jgi:hypothetical protein
MFYARQIGVLGKDPRNVPTPDCTIPGTTDGPIYIAWAHYKSDGTYNANASVNAAKAMLGPPPGYGIGNNPVAHPSLHELRRAIDWNISWPANLNGNGTLKIKWGPNGGPNGEPAGTIDKITTLPRNGGAKLPLNLCGGGNVELRAVGASYGVNKLVSCMKPDPPHWSDNGH